MRSRTPLVIPTIPLWVPRTSAGHFIPYVNHRILERVPQVSTNFFAPGSVHRAPHFTDHME